MIRAGNLQFELGRYGTRRAGAAPPKPYAILLACLFIAAAVLWSIRVSAHEIRPVIATVEIAGNGDVMLEMTLNLEAAIAGIGADHRDTSQSPAAATYDRLRSLPAAALQAELEMVADDFLGWITLGARDGSVPLTIATMEIPEVGDQVLPRISRLYLIGPAPADIRQLTWQADPRLGNSVIRIHDTASGQVLGAEFVRAGETSGPLSVKGPQRQNKSSIFVRYLEIGFTHIVPKGLDHILFVIGLFLLSTRLSALLWQVTAFTLAHTVTLALGMAGIVQLPPAIVEPLIAASIVYLAVENIITDRVHYWRPVVVFCFGLLHGLGFADILHQIGPAPGEFVLSLVAFNVGVELGQIAVIAACFLALGWTMRRTWYRSRVAIPASLTIGLIAAAWVVERTGLA